MRSTGGGIKSGFSAFNYEPSAEELSLIEKNYDLFVEQGALVIKPNGQIISSQKAAAIQAAKKKLITKPSPKVADIISFLQLLDI